MTHNTKIWEEKYIFYFKIVFKNIYVCWIPSFFLLFVQVQLLSPTYNVPQDPGAWCQSLVTAEAKPKVFHGPSCKKQMFLAGISSRHFLQGMQRARIPGAE